MTSESNSPKPPNDRQQIDALLQQALEVEAHERKGLLDEKCPPELRARVERLLSVMDDDTDTVSDPLFAGVSPDAILKPPGSGDDTPMLPDGGAARAFSDSGSGRRIGPYRIIEELGSGGMGIVYLAARDDGQFQQRVAVKLARSTTLLTEDALLRFKTERQILAGLEHPSIARLLDGGVTENGLPYFVMEVIDGLPIHRYCDQQHLPLRERLRLFLDVASAVESAHRQLVVHRDLKPSNILVTNDGQVKLLDFGIAKPLETSLFETHGLAQTRDAMSVMTPGYASPEQFRGEVISTASDTYQLGLLLYLLLTGDRPYRIEGLPIAQALARICDDPVTSPSRRISEHLTGTAPVPTEIETAAAARGLDPGRLQRALSGDLDTIVLKAMRKEPERRYPSVAALADDVRRYLDGRPVLARGESKIYQLRKLIGRNRLLVSVAAAGLVIAAALSGWAISERGRAAQRAALSRQLGEELKEMDWRLRVAQMSPLHSIEGEKDRIRERLTHLKILSEGLGDLGSGPGAYAIGRGYLLLGEPTPAVERLEEAREAGYRTPDSAAALALAYGEIFLQEKARVQMLPPGPKRDKQTQSIEQTWRDPALEHLELGRQSSLVPEAYLDAQHAFLMNDTEGALAAAADALKVAPWFFEAHLLRASLIRLEAVDLFYSDASAGEHVRKTMEAAEAYGGAARIAESAVEGHMGRCDMAGLAIHIALHDPVDNVERFEPMFRDACAKAVRVEPSNAHAWRLYADAERSWASYRIQELGEKDLHLRRAQELITRAIELEPNDIEILMSAGTVFSSIGLYVRNAGFDPRPDLAKALEYFERAAALEPQSVGAHNHLGTTLRTLARYELENGLDADASSARSLRLFQEVLLREPKGIDVENLRNILEIRVRVLAAARRDPRPEIENAIELVESLPKTMANRQSALRDFKSWLEEAGD